MRRYLITIRLPIVIVVVKFILISIVFPDIFSHVIKGTVIVVVGIITASLSGWLIFVNYERSLRKAAISGAVIYFIDHVVLTGGQFLIEGMIGIYDLSLSLWAFGGVVISFIVFSPLYMIVASAGGAAAKKWWISDVTSKRGN